MQDHKEIDRQELIKYVRAPTAIWQQITAQGGVPPHQGPRLYGEDVLVAREHPHQG